MKNRKVEKAMERIVSAVFIVSGIYLSWLAVTAGITNLLSTESTITPREATILIGYGIFALSESAAYIAKGRTLTDIVIDYIIKKEES